MSHVPRNSITSPSTVTNHNHIPCKLYQDLLSIKTNYYRILEDINVSKNEECYTKHQIQKHSQKVSKSQLVDHLSDILCSLQAVCLAEYCSDDNCTITEECRYQEKRIKMEPIEEDTKPELFSSQSWYEVSVSTIDEKIPCNTSDIFEGYTEEEAYIIEEYIKEECDEVTDTTEEQTNTETQPSFPSEVKQCRSDLIQCKKCTFLAALPSTIKLHETVHQRKQGSPYTCSLCGYKTHQSSSINKHIFVHTGEKRYKCYHCEEEYSDHTMFSSHLKKKHPDLILKCGKCDYKVFNAAEMKRHDVQHFKMLHSETEDKLHSCEKCKFTATTSLTIGLHQVVHDSKKRGPPYQCTECDYVTKEQFGFNEHILSHTGDRRFICKHCNKRFSRSHNLRRHVRRAHANCIPTLKF